MVRMNVIRTNSSLFHPCITRVANAKILRPFDRGKQITRVADVAPIRHPLCYSPVPVEE